MHPQPLQVVLSLLASAGISLVAGAIIYFLLRYFERLNFLLTLIVGGIGTILLRQYSISISDEDLVISCISSCIISLPSQAWHRMSGGVSKSAFSGFVLIFLASQLSDALMSFFSYQGRTMPFSKFLVIFYIALRFPPYWYVFAIFMLNMLPVGIIPFVLWMRKNSKLRPGIDRHLNSEDEPM